MNPNTHLVGSETRPLLLCNHSVPTKHRSIDLQSTTAACLKECLDEVNTEMSSQASAAFSSWAQLTVLGYRWSAAAGRGHN